LPKFDKARSIKHRCQLVGRQDVSVERKYNGESCQVHVNLQAGAEDTVTLFSKSGRNSTMDRQPVIHAIKKCLGIGTTDCGLERECVLVGELVVWNDHRQDIMPFYKIRRYVTREGLRLGCDEDSPPVVEEHLMIVWFDVRITLIHLIRFPLEMPNPSPPPAVKA
jgi:DNA ligase-4